MKNIVIEKIDTQRRCLMCGGQNGLLLVRNASDDYDTIICEDCLREISAAWKKYDDSLLTFQDVVNKLLENINPRRCIFIVKCANGTAFATTKINYAAKQLALEIVKSVFMEKRENLKIEDLGSIKISENDFLHPLDESNGRVSVKRFIENPYGWEDCTGIKIISLLNNEEFEL
ncbi:hypothetical protein [uncultured Dialister sp.]|uniref:hypothetical protein n=1 Tax=Dialister succinatiphilus TaxID=487173 RepID=UPI00267059E2|nr:hypothetical protein [uncultured Dialister sp.]